MTCDRCRKMADTRQCRDCGQWLCSNHYDMATHEPILDTVICTRCAPHAPAPHPLTADERRRLIDDLDAVLDRQLDTIRQDLERFKSRAPKLTKAQRDAQLTIRDKKDLIKYGEIESRGITKHSSGRGPNT